MPSDCTAAQVLTVWYGPPLQAGYSFRGNHLFLPLNESSVFCVFSLLILSVLIGYVSYLFLKSLFPLSESYLCLPLRTAGPLLYPLAHWPSEAHCTASHEANLRADKKLQYGDLLHMPLCI